jgi:hypothetical protein
MLSVFIHYAECCYAECHCAECHYAECHFAECQYAVCRMLLCRMPLYRMSICRVTIQNVDMQNAIMQNVIMQNVISMQTVIMQNVIMQIVICMQTVIIQSVFIHFAKCCFSELHGAINRLNTIAGSLCEVELDFCLSSPCSNGGQCVPDRHGSAGNRKPYVCNCPEGFHGEECEVSGIDQGILMGEVSLYH